MNPTQLIGVLAFLAAGLSSWVVSNHSLHPIWKWTRVVYTALALDVMFGWRYLLQDAVRSYIRLNGLYNDRRFFQTLLVIVAVILTAIVMHSAYLGLRRRWPSVLGSTISLVLVASLFFLEIISLHAIDRLMYLNLGDLRLIAVLWLVSLVPHFIGAYRQFSQNRKGIQNL